MKYKSNKDFRGLKEKRVFEADKPFEMSEERAEEVERVITTTQCPEFKLTKIEGPKTPVVKEPKVSESEEPEEKEEAGAEEGQTKKRTGKK